MNDSACASRGPLDVRGPRVPPAASPYAFALAPLLPCLDAHHIDFIFPVNVGVDAMGKSEVAGTRGLRLAGRREAFSSGNAPEARAESKKPGQLSLTGLQMLGGA